MRYIKGFKTGCGRWGSTDSHQQFALRTLQLSPRAQDLSRHCLNIIAESKAGAAHGVRK